MVSKLNITYLNQEEAQKADNELMTDFGFSLDILMELAGQSVAHAISHANQNFHDKKLKKLLFLAGVGNNGGDAIVAARHMSMMNYDATVMIFRDPEKQLFINLLKTCEINFIKIEKYQDKFQSNNQQQIVDYMNQFDLIIDGIFGFSYKPPMRTPYNFVIDAFKILNIPIFSIDIPSGWDVEKGNTQELFNPNYLISLTLPKLVAKQYTGIHYLGGRFIPKIMIQKYNWIVPEYSSDYSTFQILN